ncbi:MAG: ferritin family protein [Armatimonadetes bacterium]|nr:ferritin family protein [Armatimonadota bacterium]
MNKKLFDEVVQFAIDGEQEAIDAYTLASEMVTRASVKQMLLGLAKQETGHKKKLQSIDRGRVADATIADVPDLKIADYMDDVTISPGMDYQDVLSVAIKREQRSNNLYSTLASNTMDGELRRLFEFLAREEAAHKLALEKEYDEHILTDN